MTQLFGQGTTQTEAERMDALGKATGHTADETRRLNQYKKDQAEIEALKDNPTKAEAGAGKAVEEAVVEGPVKAIVEGVMKTMKDEGTGPRMNVKELETIREATEAHGKNSPEARKARADAEERVDTDRRARAELLVSRARKDPGQRALLTEMVDQNPGNFPPGFAKDMADADPKAQQQADWEAQGKRNDEANKKQEQAEKERQAKEKERAAKEKERQAKEKRDDHDREREHRKAQNDIAREVMPDIDRQAQEAAAFAAKNGLGKDDAALNLRFKLMQPNADGAFMNPDDAEAAAKAAVGPKFAEFKADPDRLRSFEREQAHRAFQHARETDPNFDEKAAGGLLESFVTSDNPAAHRARIAAELEAKGFGHDEADLAAKEDMKEAAPKVAKKISDRMFGPEAGGDAQQATMSRKFATADLADTIQAGVGGNDTKKQTQLQEEMRGFLKTMAERKVMEFSVKRLPALPRRIAPAAPGATPGVRAVGTGVRGTGTLSGACGRPYGA